MERVFAENLEKAWFEDEKKPDEGIVLENLDTNNGRVYVEIEHLDHDILKATVKCENFETPVLGIAFHLEFKKNLLHFLRYDPGNFLEQGGDPFYIVTENNGAIIFGSTLRRDDSFPVEGGDVVSIYFQKDDSYNDDSVIELNFKNGVVSGIDSTRQDIDHVNFENFSSAEVAESKENSAAIASNSNSETDNFSANVLAGGFQDYILGVLSTFGIIFLVLASVIFIKYIKTSHKI